MQPPAEGQLRGGRRRRHERDAALDVVAHGQRACQHLLRGGEVDEMIVRKAGVGEITVGENEDADRRTDGDVQGPRQRAGAGASRRPTARAARPAPPHRSGWSVGERRTAGTGARGLPDQR
ncbi:hypothetical protein D3C83_19890 [compost metagenome]